MSEKYPSLSQEANPYQAKDVLERDFFDKILPEYYDNEDKIKILPEGDQKNALQKRQNMLTEIVEAYSENVDQAEAMIKDIENGKKQSQKTNANLALTAEQAMDLITDAPKDYIDENGFRFRATSAELREIQSEKSGAAYGRLS